ncbi:MAG: MFS transporter [Myxococcota bacterium]
MSTSARALADVVDRSDPATSRRAVLSLAVLTLLFVVNYVDRQLLAILIEPIKRELGASDTAMGFLSGLAFALFYTTAGIPIARVADRGSRRRVIVWGVVVWSAMTACCGLARNFAQLAAARFGVGIGEAALAPSAHSLIADGFPLHRRATALGIFNVGGNVGVMLGFIAGGWIGETLGWRTAFLVVGLPGLAAALLARFTLDEPPRGATEPVHADRAAPAAERAAAPEPRFREVVSFLLARRTFVHVSLASAFYVFAAYGFTVWGSSFLIRVHGLSLRETGLWMGLIQGIGGGLGTFLGGVLADRGADRDPRVLVWIPALGGLLALPLLCVFLFAPTPMAALLGYAPAMVVVLFFTGPSFAVVQSLAPPRLRAQAAALLLFTMNLIGLGIAPLVVGLLNDVLAERFGILAVRYSLLVTSVGALVAVFHSLRAGRTIASDLAAARAAG